MKCYTVTWPRSGKCNILGQRWFTCFMCLAVETWSLLLFCPWFISFACSFMQSCFFKSVFIFDSSNSVVWKKRTLKTFLSRLTLNFVTTACINATCPLWLSSWFVPFPPVVLVGRSQICGGNAEPGQTRLKSSTESIFSTAAFSV